MAVYRITDKEFEELKETSFSIEGIYERYDLQRMLRDQPDVLENGLFVIAEEYGDWVESSRRIDLLALDKNGRLVVVELKREDQDSMMDLQAVRYAAMVANMTLEQAIHAHQSYIDVRGIEGDADSRIRGHLEMYDDDVRITTSNPRIILASANFSTELTTSVLWLNQVGLDITCVRLQPCKADDSLFVERSQIIPIPEATDYMVRLRDKEKEAEKQDSGGQVRLLGSDSFRDAIETAGSGYIELLRKLYEFSVRLEQEDLAELSTRVGVSNTILRVELPSTNRGLFDVIKHRAGRGYPQFYGDRFDIYAPGAKRRLETIVGRNIEQVTVFGELPDGFLDVLTDAYREARETLSHED